MRIRFMRPTLAAAAAAAVLSLPALGDSPYATQVTSSAGLQAPHDDPSAALGRPTVDANADFDLYIDFDYVPVLPVYPAWHEDNLVTVAPGGHLTLRFDHAVEDDSANPYGLDLIVFGNAKQIVGASQRWENGDPNNTIVATTNVFSEPGLVAVSQDGATWYSFPGGPFADDYAPTLGRRYDTNNPATLPGYAWDPDWNLWWGQPTDPTRPHDPTITPGDYEGMTVAEMCRYYRDCAGGTGFDIGQLGGLPATSPAGRKWIQYVRIEPSTSGLTPDIDAVADVAAATPFELWQIAHFDWWELADEDVSGASADPGSGNPNLLSYALGHDPRIPGAGGPFEHVAPTGGAVGVTYLRNKSATDVTFTLERKSGLTAVHETWASQGIQQQWALADLSNGLERVTALMPPGLDHQVIRLKVTRP